MIKFSKTALAVLLSTLILFTGCDQVKNTPNTVYIYTDGDDGGGGTTPEPPVVPTNTVTLNGPLGDMSLTADTIWILDGQVVVPSGITLDIEPGTIIAGRDGTAANAGWLIVDANGTINAPGTVDAPIIFTSELAAVYGVADAEGQWGGLTIIGNAGNDQVDPYEVDTNFVAGKTDPTDSSGTLTHVKILNSGSVVGTDQELNGLSLVGVGSGTTIEDITVDLSGDDGVELWGGTVNLTNITITRAFDDQFDIDDGYSGTVTNLNITQTTGNAAIEMSGDTYATFDTFTIIQNNSSKEGGIYFKKDGIGGHFINGSVIDNSADGFGAIHSRGDANITNTSFTSVYLISPSGDPLFTDDIGGGSSAALIVEFESGTGNFPNPVL